MHPDRVQMVQCAEDVDMVRAAFQELMVEYNELKQRHADLLAKALLWKEARAKLYREAVCMEDPIDPVDESEDLANLIDKGVLRAKLLL